MAASLSEFFPVQFREACVTAVRGHGFRLDAGFHASSASDVLETFAKGHAVTKKISELADTYGLSDFGLLRIPADKNHGVPFYTVSDIQEQEPIPAMFLSKAYEPNLSDYLVSKGYVLVSRSGSVGNVILVGKSLDGRAVANHAIRIIAKTAELSSLIYVTLSGALGKSLLKNLRYGSVIDQIKSFQINAISIPVPSEPVLGALHSGIAKASDRRDEASQLLVSAKSLILAHNQLPAIAQAPVESLDPEGVVEAAELSCAEVLSPAERCEFRLEENFYNVTVKAAIQNIRVCPSKKKIVGELTEQVFFCNRFTRTYVESEHGIPYLAGKNIVQVRPRIEHHLSISQTEELDSYKLWRGWILVTCSGTIGRTCFVWHNFEKHVATHDLIRIVPDEDKIDPGYLYAFLSSPYGYEQIMRFRHGSVIGHVTPEQLEKVIVPLPSPSLQTEIGDKVRQAYEKRADALRLEDQAQEILMREIDGQTNKEGQNG